MSARCLPLSAPHLLALFALAALPLVVTACDDGPECVIDTDCQLGLRCAATGRCERVGAGIDAGVVPLDAGPRDAAIADAGVDAGDEDAGSSDAGSSDAGDSGAACVAVQPGAYRVEEPFEGCTFPAGSQVEVREGSGGECSWLLESTGDPVVDGEFTIDEAGMITGPSLVVSGLGSAAGEGTYDPDETRITLGFPPDDCVIRLVAIGI